ncbi:MAG TPA: ABC transporter ATP-binding protein [Chloroflexia bacterium]|nr:ABC transporter ATP-binding protein [Chloroflexia bacterium]
MLRLNPFPRDPELNTALDINAPASAKKLTAGIRLEKIEKVYPMGRRQYHALRGVDLEIEPGEFVAIVGPSGSGKSTILNILTGIDRPTSGAVRIGDVTLAGMSENDLARWRGEYVGIVFQFFQLLPTLTALENVILPLHLSGSKARWQGEERRQRALANLELVGLSDHAGHLPHELSGGEQQRIAIARALANDPPLIVADEPTGNLDSETGEMVFDIFRRLADEGKTVVYVTHDPNLARQARRLIQVRDGQIVADMPAHLF